MRRLILLRHAKTERQAASGADFDRALTERGRTDAARTAESLAAAGLIADLALVSTAVRARQTFEAAKAFLPDVRLELVPTLYNAAPETLLRAAQKANGDTVLVIAHNPGVHALAMELVEGALCEPTMRAEIQAGFPTATAAVFEFGDGRTGCLGVFNAHSGGAT
ncbi:histidine phosphatase family protein [Caulobacter sp. S45]|uniref:SixA phosphatase family protein n=1 Tax=Caulobacter sp. S45 TaxID=1641861 RepID=UPI00131C7E78|nr:histidine phosphatase family protein [Caulobacter sp. S45]